MTGGGRASERASEGPFVMNAPVGVLVENKAPLQHQVSRSLALSQSHQTGNTHKCVQCSMASGILSLSSFCWLCLTEGHRSVAGNCSIFVDNNFKSSKQEGLGALHGGSEIRSNNHNDHESLIH